MEIVSLRKGSALTIRTTILRALASVGILSTGGSVGREGPIIQIAASFAGRYRTKDADYTDAELAEAQHLVATKFATPEWTFRVP